LKTNLFWPQDGWLCIWASGVHLFLYCRNRPSNGSNIVVRTLGVHSFHQVHIGNLMKPDVTNGLFENWIPQIPDPDRVSQNTLAFPDVRRTRSRRLVSSWHVLYSLL
jgi:hypothetical protein